MFDTVPVLGLNIAGRIEYLVKPSELPLFAATTPTEKYLRYVPVSTHRCVLAIAI